MEDIDKLMAFIDCKLPQLLIIIRQILFLGWEKKYFFVIRPQFFLYQLTLFVDTARSLINSSYEGQTLNTFSEGIQTPDYTTSMELRVKHSDGSWRHVELLAKNLLHEPSVESVVINYRDITEKKHAEDDIRVKHEDIEDAKKALAELGDNISAKKVWKQLGL